jgi:hypothetical protein
MYFILLYIRSLAILHLKYFINFKDEYYADATDLSTAADNDDHITFDMLLKCSTFIDSDALQLMCDKDSKLPFIKKILEELIIDNKSNYDSINKYFEETLISAVEADCIEIVDYLFSLNFPINEELIAYTAKNGKTTMIKKLIMYGVKIPTCTAVNNATKEGYLYAVKYLIEVAKAPFSNSALTKVVKGNHYKLCEYLLRWD